MDVAAQGYQAGLVEAYVLGGGILLMQAQLEAFGG